MGNGGLGFWPRAAPPPARGGPCSCSVPPAARAARPPGARPAAPPSRFGAIAPSALFGPMDGAKRKRNARPLQSSGLPPATPRRASAAGGLAVAGAGGVRPGPSRAAVVCVGRLRPRPSLGGGRPPPRWSATRGRACGALRAARRAGCGRSPGAAVCFRGPPAAPGVAASPWPSPARPRLWSMLGGAPQPPGGRVGGVPPVVLFGLVPGRRFALAPPSPRGRKGGRARRPAPLGSKCGPGRGGLDSAACGRRGTAGGINAPGWWIANERHP